MSLKQLLITLLFISNSFFSFCATSDSIKPKRVYYSLEQKERQEQWNNITYYPVPKVSDTEFRDSLTKWSNYPPIAKQKRLGNYSEVHVKYTIDGLLEFQDSTKEVFMTSAINLLKQTNGMWKPAIERKKGVEMEVTIPVKFGLFFKNNQVQYYIKPFINYKSIICDSSDTFPALLYETTEDDGDTSGTYLITEKKFNAREIMNDDSTYGTVSIGFDIDTTGEISEINILNSIHPKLDSHAVAFIRNTHTKWIPSYKNGEKRPSHKVFNLHYQTLIANYKRLNQNATSISKRYLHNIDYSVALEYFMDKQYEKAMIKLNKVCNYSIDNPSAFYYRGLTHLNLGNAEKGCEDIKYAQVLAEQYGYPAIMEKDKVMDFLQKSCGEE